MANEIPDYDDPDPEAYYTTALPGVRFIGFSPEQQAELGPRDDRIMLQVDEEGRRYVEGEPYPAYIEENQDRPDALAVISDRFESNDVDVDSRVIPGSFERFARLAQEAATMAVRKQRLAFEQSLESKPFEDNEGAYKDTGLTSYNETRRPAEAPGGGTLIRASGAPFNEYEYSPAALRQAEADTKRSEREYEEGLARKEAERTRGGRQDPAPTLGPSMTE